MNGKGSKQRPRAISDTDYENNWDRIFGMKDKEKTTHNQVSRHWSDNGKKEAVVIFKDPGFEIELYEQSRYIRTVECHDKSLSYAEDVAENFCLGMLS